MEGIQSAAEAEVIELEDDEEKERRAKDPLYRCAQVVCQGVQGMAERVNLGDHVQVVSL